MATLPPLPTTCSAGPPCCELLLTLALPMQHTGSLTGTAFGHLPHLDQTEAKALVRRSNESIISSHCLDVY